MSKSFLILLSVIFFLKLLVSCNGYNNDNENISLKDSVTAGKTLFEDHCSRCHGMDASGLTGPSLKRLKLAHAPDRESFVQVIQQGIPGTGMPAHWDFEAFECNEIYTYISSLKNKKNENPPGDPEKGKIVYAAKVNCSACHIINGEGTGVGPELSEIGATRSPEYLKQAIIAPEAILPENTEPENGYGFSSYLPVKVTTNDGKEITGLRINEDSYTIQLKDIANNFYSFNKQELKSVEKLYGQSLMPSFKNTLTDSEMEDLVAYLYKLGNQ